MTTDATSRELTYRAMEFKKPARVPIYYFNRDVELSDINSAWFGPDPSFHPSVEGATEWGYVWDTLDGTMGQPKDPPLADPANISSYQSPDPHVPGRLAHLDRIIAASKDKFLKYSIGITGFNQVTFLRGFEDFLTDLFCDRKLAERVLDIVFDFEHGLIEEVAPYPIDCVQFADDWGTQRGLIISPELWREVFKPRYAEQFEMIHSSGKKVWFHSCGDVWEIVGDLIDIGVDVLELLQPDVFGIERLGREFGGRVCFCCSIDHQRLAVSGTKDEIFRYAELLNHHLGRFDGGFIPYIEDYPSLGMTDQSFHWICEAFRSLR